MTHCEKDRAKKAKKKLNRPRWACAAIVSWNSREPTHFGVVGTKERTPESLHIACGPRHETERGTGMLLEEFSLQLPQLELL